MTIPFVDFRAQLRCRSCNSGDVSTIVDPHRATPQERWERERDGLAVPLISMVEVVVRG